MALGRSASKRLCPVGGLALAVGLAALGCDSSGTAAPDASPPARTAAVRQSGPAPVSLAPAPSGASAGVQNPRAPAPSSSARSGAEPGGSAVAALVATPTAPPRAVRAPVALPLSGELPAERSLVGPRPGLLLRARLESPLERAERARLPAPPAELELLLLPGLGDEPRARLRLMTAAFALPVGTELRLRGDALGQLLVWPDGRGYRVVPHSATRALLGERRPDAAPQLEVRVEQRGAAKLLGRAVEVHAVSGHLGSVELSLAAVPEAGDAAPLLCRFLLALLRAGPELGACEAEALPLRAVYHWGRGGSLEFAVDELVLVKEQELVSLSMPPLLPIHKPGEVPPLEQPALLDQTAVPEQTALAEQTALPEQTALLEAPDGGVLEAPARDGAPAAEGKATVEFVNAAAVPLYFVLEGVAPRLLGPGVTLRVRAPLGAVRYRARDFLGELLVPVETAAPPARVLLGAAAAALVPAAPR